MPAAAIALHDKMGKTMTAKAIRNIEQGVTKRPPIATILMLCKLYGVDEATATGYYNEAYGITVVPSLMPDANDLVTKPRIDPALSMTQTAALRDKVVLAVMKIIDDYGMRSHLVRDGKVTQSFVNVEGSISRAVEKAIREVGR